jgi:hypothetical protein
MVTDFVLSLDGVIGFRPPDWLKDPKLKGTEAYFNRRAALGQERAFLRGFCGVKDSDIATVRDQLVSQMRERAGGQFQRAGVLCLFGSSHGASVALALAAVLQNELTINYVCLADLSIFAGGSNPPVPEVGALAPSAPVMIRTARSLIGSSIVNADGDRPRVSLQPDINAKVKENYYQHSGNGIKASRLTGDWFWTSDMKNGEIHGVISNPGWRNLEVINLRIEHSGLEVFFQSKGDKFHAAHNDHVEQKVWSERWPVELAKI